MKRIIKYVLMFLAVPVFIGAMFLANSGDFWDGFVVGIITDVVALIISWIVLWFLIKQINSYEK